MAQWPTVIGVLLLCVLACAESAEDGAADARPMPLGPPEAVFPEDFGYVHAVREGEYMQPDAVWPLPGDSTLLVDLGKAQLVRLGPDLGFGATHQIAMFQNDGGVVMATPAAVDDHGSIYAASMSGYPPDPEVFLRRLDEHHLLPRRPQRCGRARL